VRALTGWALDVITNGVPLDGENPRGQVIAAVRSVMLSAHRADYPWHLMHTLLMDTNDRKLAQQLATGRGGRTIGTRQRTALLKKLWDDTEKVAQARPAWNRDQALDAIEFIRDNWHLTETLPDKWQQVLGVALQLATEYGTTRPAIPSRVVAERTGLPLSTANYVIRQIANDGEWLRLAQKGNRHTRRASLYVLAPSLLNVWGASPPVSNAQPMSNPPMSNVDGDSMSMSITVTGNSQEALRQALQLIAAASPEELQEVVGLSDAPRLRLLAGGASK
jgi:hypothetical protein